jgi:hypothetical protein
MTGLAAAIHLGEGVLKSSNPAIMVGGDAIVIVECVVGDDPDEKDPPDDEDVPEAA